MRFFLILLLLPVVEISLFLTVADEIGLLPAISLLGAAALAGFFILQNQGVKAIQATRNPQEPAGNGTAALTEIFDGLCLALAGGLLVIPGYLSDLVALILLLPPVRARLRDRIGGLIATRASGFRTAGFGTARFTTGDAPPDFNGSHHRDFALDAEYEVVPPAPDNDNSKKHPPLSAPPPDEKA